jgi:hypothetical protein
MTIITSEIISLTVQNTLAINYFCKTEHVIYCIADFGGNVLMRGKYECLEENHISVKDLPKGTYTFCIIDGDLLTKAPFLKDQ